MVALPEARHDHNYIKALLLKLTPDQRRLFNERTGNVDLLDSAGILRAKIVLEEVLELSGLAGVILEEVRELRMQQSRDYATMFTADTVALLGKYFTWDTQRLTPEQLAGYLYRDILQVLSLLPSAAQKP